MSERRSRWRLVASAAAVLVAVGGGPAAAQPAATRFMAEARTRAEAGPPPPQCRLPELDPAGNVLSSTLPGQVLGDASGTTGGLSHRLLLVTQADNPRHAAPPGSLNWAVQTARREGGGWIAFAPRLQGTTIRVETVLALPSNTTVDGGCGGITLAAPPRTTTLRVQNETNIIISGLAFVKDSYVDTEDKTGDAVGLDAFFDRVAVLHNDFHRCGDGCVDIVRKVPIDRLSRITVAFNHFSDHNKVMLVGSLTCYINHAAEGCDAPLAHLEDSMRPTLRLTLLGNLFEGTSQRHPKVVSNGIVDSVNNLIEMAPTTYPGGRLSAVYGQAAASGGLLVSRGDLFVNPTGSSRLGAGPVSAVSEAAGPREEGDGAIALGESATVGPVRLVEMRPQLALAYATPGLRLFAPGDPLALAACLLRVAGPRGASLDWPASCRSELEPP